MGDDAGKICVRVAAVNDVGAIATLRSLWSAGSGADPEFRGRMADWLVTEGDRRTTWLATLSDLPVGMASLLEYRRMPKPGGPDSCWGYISNMFVREGFRNRGIGSSLLAALIGLLMTGVTHVSCCRPAKNRSRFTPERDSSFRMMLPGFIASSCVQAGSRRRIAPNVDSLSGEV